VKLLISLLAAACSGCLVYGLAAAARSVPLPKGDFATQALRRFTGSLIARELPAVSRYLRHLQPILQDVPLPPTLDVPMFIALHAAAGVPLWIVIAYAFPGFALWMFPVCVLAGLFLPYAWLKSRQAKFHIALLKALPEWLDLQVIVMEAGLYLNAGIQHYLQKGTASPLQPLLATLQNEIKMGRSRGEAFSGLAERSSFGPLKDVARSIVQALTLGTSLAPLLREQAAALRVRRMQIAEKKAAEAPLKMLFPLFVFIFPTIFIVLLGPMAIMFMRGGF
jgi:tight adherence protein C